MRFLNLSEVMVGLSRLDGWEGRSRSAERGETRMTWKKLGNCFSAYADDRGELKDLKSAISKV